MGEGKTAYVQQLNNFVQGLVRTNQCPGGWVKPIATARDTFRNGDWVASGSGTPTI